MQSPQGFDVPAVARSLARPSVQHRLHGLRAPHVAIGLAWVVFWALLFLLGAQQYVWSGGGPLWQPATEYGTAAVFSTLLALTQLRRAVPLDQQLGRPARWFLGLWRWLPLEASLFVTAMLAVPRAIHAALGVAFPYSDWLETSLYELGAFGLFYVLFGIVLFGVHSSRAFGNELLRAEQNARQAQAAQLAQLTQQLRPHFLFNALNTVSSLIHTEPVLADTLLTRLATLLRAATSASQHPEQSLAEELALLRAYADIMEQRFAGRVQLEWQIEPGAEVCQVPTLGLQAVLENCFGHAVEKRRAPTGIVVRAWREPPQLVVEIENDGQTPALPPTLGVGLGTLQQRLALLHGGAARLALLPRPDGGLIVRVELPCGC